MSTSAHSVPSGLSLRANFSWTFVGNIVYAGCQWGVLVVLAKLGSPEMVGQFTLGLAIVTPVVMFANLQLRNVQATDAKREYRFGDYLGLRLITTVLALLIIAGIMLVTGYRWETALVILAVGMTKAFEAISDVFYGLLQQHERMDRVAKSKMIKGPLSLAVLSVGGYLTGSVFWSVMGLAVAYALTLIYDIRSGVLILRPREPFAGSAIDEGDQQAVLRPHWDTKMLVNLAWLALPLGVVMSLLSLKTSVPRYFVERYLGERSLGIFAAIAYIQQAGTTVVGALGQSATPRLAKCFAAKDSGAFRALLLKLVGIGTLLGGAGVLAALVAGREILTLLYRPEYGERDLFVWLMVGAGVGYVAGFLGYSMMATRVFRAQVPLFVVVVGTAAVTCLWLVPSRGMYGAAAALIAANTVQVGGALSIVVYALRTLDRHIGESGHQAPKEE